MKRHHSVETSLQVSPPVEKNETSALKKFKPDYSDDLVTILVGSTEKFVIHKSALCKHSSFFQAASGREWKEGQERVIRLPEADGSAFAAYAHWVYSETLDMDSNANLGKLWSFGNFLNDHVFANRVIDRLLQRFDNSPGQIVFPESLGNIWTITPQGCDVQRVLLDMMAARMNEQDLEKDKDKYPQDLLLELAKRYVSGQGKGKSPTFADRCNYHTHEDGEARCQ